MSINKDHISVLVIAFLASSKHEVGSARTRALAKFLDEKGYRITFTPEAKNNYFIYRYIWLISSLFKIVFFKGKNVYLSVGPFFPLLPISLICFIFRKKLIVDFRDPWSLNILTLYGKHQFNWNLPKSWKFKIATIIEKITYRICSAFVVCTKGMEEAYSELFKDNQKIHLIQNGFDFEPSPTQPNSLKSKNIIHFICVGKFAEYNYQKASNTIEELIKLLVKQNKAYHFTLIGCNEQLNQKIFQNLRITKHVTFLTPMPYEQAIKHIEKCDVGITLVRNEYLEYGTKIFDYIGLGKPVWALVDKSQPFYMEFKDFLITENNFFPKLDINSITIHQRSYQYQKFLEFIG